MITNKNTLKNWFRTSLKPTQAQFWATWDSFWHKDEPIPQSNISGLETALNTKVEKSQFETHEKDANAHTDLLTKKADLTNGIVPDIQLPVYVKPEDLKNKADLINGKVPSQQLPNYESDIVERNDLNSFPNPGETGKIYISLDRNFSYRWTGTHYAQITNGVISTTDDVSEGLVNKYSTLSLVMSYALTGISFASETTINATDSILSAFGKLQRQINDIVTVLGTKQVKDEQIEIGSTTSVQNTWNGKTILFTTNCTITVPSTLAPALMFSFRTLIGVTVTWVITSPFSWETMPTSTPEKTVGHFMRRGATYTVILDA